MRFRPLVAMMGGILVLSAGVGLMFSMQNGWLVLLGILVFSMGEMASSPKFTEYIGTIAPDDKKALYMGTSFLPIAAGHQLAGWLSGSIFERMSDKYYLLKCELVVRNLQVPSVSGNFSKNDFWNEAATRLGMSSEELNRFIWENYHPGRIWILFSGIAVSAVVFLCLYDRFVIGRR